MVINIRLKEESQQSAWLLLTKSLVVTLLPTFPNGLYQCSFFGSISLFSSLLNHESKQQSFLWNYVVEKYDMLLQTPQIMYT